MILIGGAIGGALLGYQCLKLTRDLVEIRQNVKEIEEQLTLKQCEDK
jgi:hypothetical protein